MSGNGFRKFQPIIASVHPSIKASRPRKVEYEIRCSMLHRGGSVVAVQRIECLAHNLDVLRHGPWSISDREICAFHAQQLAAFRPKRSVRRPGWLRTAVCARRSAAEA